MASHRATGHGWDWSVGRGLVVALAVLLSAGVFATGGGSAGAAPATRNGTIESGATPLGGYEVALYRMVPDAAPEVLGSTTSQVDGTFSIEHDVVADLDRISYVVARARRVRGRCWPRCWARCPVR